MKSLNESGDMGAMHGRIAIGVLIMQDIIAVVFRQQRPDLANAWYSKEE